MIPTPATDPLDLFNTIQRPDRYFRVVLAGTFVECVMISISDEAYAYWTAQPQERLTHYIKDPAYYTIKHHLPRHANFMLLDYEDLSSIGLADKWASLQPTYQAWYAMSEPMHEYYGGQLEQQTIEVFEVDSDGFFSAQIGDSSIVTTIPVKRLIETNQLMLVQREAVRRIKDIDCNVVSVVETSVRVSYEALIHTNTLIDPRLIVINSSIQPDGVEIVENIMYNGVIVDDENYDVIKNNNTLLETELFQFGRFPGTK